MPKIYLTGSGASRGYHTGSGFLSLPPRISIRANDNRLGSYPAVSRTGDHDFSGIFESTYDDTKTVTFVGDDLLYPKMLPLGNVWVNEGISTPNVFHGISAPATSSSGISDNFLHFSESQNISPFVENRIYQDNDSSFYQTGTTGDVVPGFSSKLSSKTQIVIDTDPITSTDFYFSTGTSPNASGIFEGVNSSMGYFDWVSKKWEIIGNLTSGSNIDILNSDTVIRHNGLLPFVPSSLANFSGELFQDPSVGPISKSHGLPFSNFGFPFASRYDATGSQLLSMKNYISSPLLLEKIVVEFSASFGPHVISTQFYGPNIKQFFLLRQGNSSGSLQNFQDSVLLSSSTSGLGTETTINIQHGLRKDIIAYGQVSLLGGPSSPQDYYRDLNIFTPPLNLDQTARYPITGSYTVKFLPKVVSKNNFAGSVGFANGDTGNNRVYPFGIKDREIAKILFGGRSMFDISDGRSFVKSVGALTPSGSYDTATSWLDAGSSSVSSFLVSTTGSLEHVSPFILLPEDNIIFGFCNTPNWYGYTQNPNMNSARYEESLKQANVVLSPGKGKITLYGSLLQNNLPISPESNQPLTSESVHESIQYLSPVYDQFDVEPICFLTGTYIDNIVSGRMVTINDNTIAAVSDSSTAIRRVVGNVAGGQAGTTGSLQRFVRIVSPDEVFIDSRQENFTGSNGTKIQTIGSYGYTDARYKQISMKVRRDSHGQFRDVLEQGKEAAFSKTGLGLANRPIEIKFFSRDDRSGTASRPTSPEFTHSQNLSLYATSSMPYFDNQVIDRLDDPDVTLADSSVIV